MFATIRKHQQWLFVLICGVIIVSFVIFFSPDIGVGDRGRPTINAMINGQPVPPAEFDAAYEEASIDLFLNSGGRWWPWSREFPDFYATNFNRQVAAQVVIHRKLKELKIEVNEDAVVERIRLFWRGENGAYDPDRYKGFITNTLASVRAVKLTEADYFRYVRHQLAQGQLRDSFAVSGQLVTKAAAEAEFRRENERVATEGVFFNLSNYVADVTIETNAVRKHFTQNLGRYRIPAKAQVRYVRFDATNYLAEAEKKLSELISDVTVELERIYLQNGPDSYVDDEGKALPAEKAHGQIRGELLEPLQLHAARFAANGFAHALHAELQKLKNAGSFLVESNFIQIAEAQKLKTLVTDSFTRADGPEGFDARAEIANVAFQLVGTQLVSIEPIIGRESVYFIALNKLDPNKPKEFKDVEKEVTEDFRQQQARIGMQAATRELYQKITNSVAAGKAFKAAAEELKLTVVEVDPFSKSEPTNIEVAKRDIGFTTYRNTAFFTEVGKTSRPQFPRGSEAGFMLHVKGPVAADEVALKEELDGYVNMFRQRRQSAAFQAWYSREVEAAGIAFAN
ncbi:MAG: hypothetical protein ACI8V5_000373 [Limisphaerales bacterium]|jgi:hypothetical protein